MFTIDYYNETVREMVYSLPPGILKRYLDLRRRMIEHGPNLGSPHTEPMGGGLFEIRAKSKEGIGRVFYCCLVGRRIMILHVIVRKPKRRRRMNSTRPEGGWTMSRKSEADEYKPVPEDHERMLAAYCRRHKGFAEELGRPDPEMEALDVMLEARRRSGLTQKEVARRMKVSRPLVARFEMGRHTPSLGTLMRYADACGCRLRIALEPKESACVH